MLSHSSREERRRTNERCLWCFAESNESKPGTVLNESATGLLLQAEEPLSVGQRIWVLCMPGDDPTVNPLPPEYLINHPLSRGGKIVRVDETNQAGIQFDNDEKERPRYQRWYRGKSSIVTLLEKERATVTLSGWLNFESAILLEKLFTKQSKTFKEILFSCHDVDHINGTALTVLRSALRQCDKSGIVLTVLTGSETLVIFEKNLVLENGYHVNLQSIPVLADSPAALPKTPPPTSPETPDIVVDGIVVISRGISQLNRLAQPLERFSLVSWKTQSFKEAPELIATNNPRFVVIEVELEHCPSLIDINRIRRYSLSRIPPAMVIGPLHLGELIKEALAVPVKIYLPKPCTDREYINGLQAMLTQNYDTAKTE